MANNPARKTIDRALVLLSLFTAERQERGVIELSQEMGLEKSIVSRMLKTLAQHGFVDQDARSKRYQLGPKILALAATLGPDRLIGHKAQPFLNLLAARTGETAVLAVRLGWTCVCKEVVESRNGLRVGPEIGRQTPLHAGAMGKAILAKLPEPDLEYYLRQSSLPRLTERSIGDPPTLWAELQEVREQGYAFSSGEIVLGAVALAAPLFDSTGAAVASLTVEMPDVRFRPESTAALAELVCAAAAELSKQLGYDPRTPR